MTSKVPGLNPGGVSILFHFSGISLPLTFYVTVFFTVVTFTGPELEPHVDNLRCWMIAWIVQANSGDRLQEGTVGLKSREQVLSEATCQPGVDRRKNNSGRMS